MGQKVNPHGLRVGVISDWDSRWYAESDFADNLVEDYKIRKYLKDKLKPAGIPAVERYAFIVSCVMFSGLISPFCTAKAMFFAAFVMSQRPE